MRSGQNAGGNGAEGPWIDSMIELLLSARNKKPGTPVELSAADATQLCTQARDIFLSQPMLLELGAPIKICGDVHGQYTDLLRLFEYGGFPPEVSYCHVTRIANSAWGLANYLFLGDYVDRGKQSLEVVCLLFAYKIKYPENFFLLRGNHECAGINRIYGFYDECRRRFSNSAKWIKSPILLARVMSLIRGSYVTFSGRIQIPALRYVIGGVLERLGLGWGENDRGVSFTFGGDVVRQFLRRHDLDLVVRAHQVVEDGYEFFAGRELVTVFSAPNYCGEFDNAGAMMTVDDTLMCSFQILKPANPAQNRGGYAGGRQGTPGRGGGR
eukprot:scaffold4724_cov166-Amphora_coffeaeformis.AAC.1